ncbi:MAG: hypothetical protein R3247_11355 [Rhodothermales bacterium]|nr:hypothetical protein [Rhodothermales bacterium]
MTTNPQAAGVLRTLGAGIAGGLAWIGAMLLLFGPAQTLLANPAYQSEKFLFVVGELEPLPRAAGAWWILVVGLLALGMLYGVVYRVVRPAFAGRPWWRRGVGFGAVAWALMVPWFEFYLPWNVMHEPALLVLLEGVLWLGVMLLVGLAIAGVYEWRLD